MKFFLNVVAISAILISTNGLEIKEFTDGNNLFTANVYKELLKNEKGNILVSPLSAEIVLALTQSGAKDETAAEIRNSLHLPSTDEKTRNALKNLLTRLKSGQDYTLHTANKVYVSDKVPIKDEFKAVATDVYKAELENINFSKKVEAAATVNKWVEAQTKNKIQNLVEPNVLSETTALLLVNALYFQGRWLNKFKEDATKKTDFYKTANDVIKVDTMNSHGKIREYHESTDLNAKFLKLHFEGEDASIVFVLPNEKEGLASLENQLEKVFKPPKFAFESVNVALPKFKINSKIDFKEILKSLGVSKAFGTDADLSGMAGKKGDLTISEVIQKSFIDLNEEGVEAAAATFVLPVLGSGLPPPNPKTFIADHPFIFYILVKDTILFAGRVSEPTV